MHNKNPYGVPYDEMIEGAIFYDMWRKQWVVLVASLVILQHYPTLTIWHMIWKKNKKQGEE